MLAVRQSHRFRSTLLTMALSLSAALPCALPNRARPPRRAATLQRAATNRQKLAASPQHGEQLCSLHAVGALCLIAGTSLALTGRALGALCVTQVAPLFSRCLCTQTQRMTSFACAMKLSSQEAKQGMKPSALPSCRCHCRGVAAY